MPPVRPSTKRCWSRSGMVFSWVLSRLASALAPYPQDFVKYKQDCAERYGHIGDVERREVPVAPVEQQKVHDMAVKHAIDQVSYCTAQNKGKGRTEQDLLRISAKQMKDEPDGTDCNNGK